MPTVRSRARRGVPRYNRGGHGPALDRDALRGFGVSAYLELEYQRAEDGLPVTLLAPLPTVRSLLIGGDPSDLRLPGLPPDAACGRVCPAGTGHRVEPASAGPELRLNGWPVPPGGVRLEPGDVLAVEGYRLTYHAGDLPDTPMAETHLRWRLPASAEHSDEELFETDARPLVEEFELTLRPLLRAEAVDAVRQRVEAELQRILRLADDEPPEDYIEYLWWTRLRAVCQQKADDAGAVAREAYDLFPRSRRIAEACGLVFLTESDWDAAQAAFARALRYGGRRALAAAHDARLGGLLAAHFAALHDRAGREPVPAGHIGSLGWDVPRFDLHVAGDETLLWRMAWRGRVFGQPEDVRFVLRRQADADDGGRLQHWEIYDVRRGVAWRRLVRMPGLLLADPSLALEVDSFRKSLLEYKPFAALLLEHSEQEPERPPVVFDETALAALPARLGGHVTCARLSLKAGQVQLDLVTQPQSGDVAYSQGGICAAIAPHLVERWGGSTLRHEKRRGFRLRTEGGQETRVRYRAPRMDAPASSRLAIGIACFIGTIALLSVLARLLSRA